VLGIDRSFENTAIGRSDTNILLSINTLSGEVKGISIPRDLWVKIPNYGENRINAAHYFGEGEAPGNGVILAMDTLEFNFQIRPDYYIRIQLEKFPQVIDSLGGIDITLTETTAGYAPGTHHLDGTQALAFVRNRSGTDDFFRMAQGQIFLKAFLQKLLRPSGWVQIPNLIIASLEVIDTNIPIWQQPRLLVAVLRASQNKFELTAISREMVTPWVTDAGAQVLLPRWELIRPLFNRTFSP
jgi:LCP family protein required for cell wall assembly